jgi:hypothetical protein
MQSSFPTQALPSTAAPGAEPTFISGAPALPNRQFCSNGRVEPSIIDPHSYSVHDSSFQLPSDGQASAC